MRSLLGTLLGSLLIAGALTPVHAAAAAPADCTTDLNSGSSLYLADSVALWDIDRDGAVEDGRLLPVRDDAYDVFPVFAIDDGTNGHERYFNQDENFEPTCTYEDEGRQIAFPTATMTGGLEISRKVYVPASGPGFARFYNQVHNPGANPVTITIYTANGDSGELGSNFSTTVEDSSAGTGVGFVDDELDTDVSWFTTSDDPADDQTADPVLAHNLDAGFGHPVNDRVDSVTHEPLQPGQLSFVYEDVTVPAGGTVAYLLFEAMRATTAEAGIAARYIDSQPAALFAGLSDAELAAIQNWDGLDMDGDAVPNTTDNCPTVFNPDQANTDGGTSGDACDGDIDGDGIPNDVETAFGTNPYKADTDDDGVRDNADNCPKVAGKGTDGCPAATPAPVVVDNVRRASTTKLKVTETKTGAVTIKTKGTVVGSGAPTAKDCTHGQAAVIIKVAGLTVSNRLVKLKTDCTFKSTVTLDQPRRLVKKVVVTGRFLGSDALLPSKKKVKLP